MAPGNWLWSLWIKTGGLNWMKKICVKEMFSHVLLSIFCFVFFIYLFFHHWHSIQNIRLRYILDLIPDFCIYLCLKFFFYVFIFSKTDHFPNYFRQNNHMPMLDTEYRVCAAKQDQLMCGNCRVPFVFLMLSGLLQERHTDLWF